MTKKWHEAYLFTGIAAVLAVLPNLIYFFGCSMGVYFIYAVFYGIIAFCAFSKRRGNILSVATILLAITDIYYLGRNFKLWLSYDELRFRFSILCCIVASLCCIIASILLAVIVCSKSQVFMNKFKKIWFLPGALYLIVELFFQSPGSFSIFYFLLAIWFLNPEFDTPKEKTYTPGTNYSGNTVTDGEMYCELVKHILLSVFTFGVWYYMWIYKATKYLNKTPNSEQYNPTNQLLLCLFVPFYSIYWYYKHGQKVDAMYIHKKGVNSDITTLCLILSIFVPVVACIIMQDKINNLLVSNPNNVNMNYTTVNNENNNFGYAENENMNNTTKNNESINFDDIEKLKDLLDKGIITQEEFDIKKKQMLGL